MRPRSRGPWKAAAPFITSPPITACGRHGPRRCTALTSTARVTCWLPLGAQYAVAARKAAWKPNVVESQTPWQELQRRFVGQLSTGACLDFAVDFQRVAQTKGVPRHSH